MVTFPADAEDATQEILIKAMTRLSTFQGDAAFSTWVHRIAVNHLLDRKKSGPERLGLTFEAYGDDLRDGLAAAPSSRPDAALLEQEVKLSCTQAMLLCLDREHRVAYVLGEVFEMRSDEAAHVCEVTPAAYRKRLSRARSRVRAFLNGSCSLVNPSAPCRCSHRVDTAVRLGRIDPAAPRFATHPTADVEQGVREMTALFDAASLFQSHPPYRAPEALSEQIRALLATTVIAGGR